VAWQRTVSSANTPSAVDSMRLSGGADLVEPGETSLFGCSDSLITSNRQVAVGESTQVGREPERGRQPPAKIAI
jgi:hypothetical protein